MDSKKFLLFCHPWTNNKVDCQCAWNKQVMSEEKRKNDAIMIKYFDGSKFSVVSLNQAIRIYQGMESR